MSAGLNLTPFYLATRQGKEDALLAIAGGRLVAILVRVEAEPGEAGPGGWYLEAGFGPCEAEGLVFSAVGDAENWVSERLRRDWGADWSSAAAPEPLLGAKADRAPAEPLPLRILIVEDDAVHALDLERHLARSGHEVVDTVSTGPEAVRAATRERPDVVFMDVRLANGTDGIEAAIEIQRHLGIPAVFVSGHSDPDTRTRMEMASPLEFLAKPVSSAAITAALHKAAQMPRARRLLS